MGGRLFFNDLAVRFDFLVSFSIVIIDIPRISAPRYSYTNRGRSSYGYLRIFYCLAWRLRAELKLIYRKCWLVILMMKIKSQ